MITHPIPPHLLPPHQPRRRHPFTDFIANTPLPTQWEPFTLDRYTGETDPDEHLKVYITHVALYTSQDAVFCKAFPTTLKGLALEWFTTLPPYSIDSFDVLSHMFSTHFAGSRPHQTTTISLLGIRQEQGEPLRAFIDRFSKAALRTPHLSAWHLPCNPAPSPTTFTSTHLPLCANLNYMQPTTSAWRKCKPSTPNSAMTMQQPPPTLPRNLLDHSSPATSLHQICPPYRSSLPHPR